MSTPWSPQVARAMHELADAAPMPPSAEGLAGHQPPAPPRSRTGVAMAAAVLVVAALAGLVVIARRDDGSTVGDSTVEVYHARFTTTIDAQIQCATPFDANDRFTTSTTDLWADRAGRQWRNTVTYPDGTTYEIIRRGSAIYPTEMASKGAAADQRWGCHLGGDDYQFVTPLSDGIVSLTTAAEITPDERPYVKLPSDVAELVDANAVDAEGRATQLWEERIDGTWTGDSTPETPLTQVRRWWIDATDGTVTQQQFVDSPEGLGTVTSTMTMTKSETIRVPADRFDTSGWTQMETGPRPDRVPVPSGPTLSDVSPSVAPTTDPASDLAHLATTAMCDEAIRLLAADQLANPPHLVTDLRSMPTDGLPATVLGGFEAGVDALEASYTSSAASGDGYSSEVLSSFLTDTCGRGEIPAYFAIP